MHAGNEFVSKKNMFDLVLSAFQPLIQRISEFSTSLEIEEREVDNIFEDLKRLTKDELKNKQHYLTNIRDDIFTAILARQDSLTLNDAQAYLYLVFLCKHKIIDEYGSRGGMNKINDYARAITSRYNDEKIDAGNLIQEKWKSDDNETHMIEACNVFINLCEILRDNHGNIIDKELLYQVFFHHILHKVFQLMKKKSKDLGKQLGAVFDVKQWLIPRLNAFAVDGSFVESKGEEDESDRLVDLFDVRKNWRLYAASFNETGNNLTNRKSQGQSAAEVKNCLSYVLEAVYTVFRYDDLELQESTIGDSKNNKMKKNSPNFYQLLGAFESPKPPEVPALDYLHTVRDVIQFALESAEDHLKDHEVDAIGQLKERVQQAKDDKMAEEQEKAAAEQAEECNNNRFSLGACGIFAVTAVAAGALAILAAVSV